MNKYIVYCITTLVLSTCSSDKASFTISEDDRQVFYAAHKNGIAANEGFIRCNNFVNGWLEQSDPKTGLIPRNLERSKDFWNAKDAAADNYPFMVLTSFFVDQELFDGRMLDMLNTEKKITSRIRSLPDTYSFSMQDFLEKEVKQGPIVFGASEYIKDGLLPLTEYLGPTPWSDRMIEMLYDLNEEIDVANEINEEGFGSVAKEEVNGELLQVLSRIYWMTGDKKFLDWATLIGDHYLLGDHHPTRDLEYLRLRDHGCELVSGLCELYITTSFALPDKKERYQKPLSEMLDRILEVGRNEDGMFYDAINPQTGEIVRDRVADTWGYTLNGFYGVYLIDGKQEYKQAVLKVFSNLYKYKNFNWEGGSSDGYADAIESALNLYNRISDPAIADWIDSEIRVMWNMQQENGIIEGWHGDGNFARTTIMHNLWKSKGLYVKPWRDDLILGAEQKGDSLLISLSSDRPWSGKLYFDKERYKENMKLPVDWPRINQFPEWVTVQKEAEYQLVDVTEKTIEMVTGQQLLNGKELSLADNKNMYFY